jgi:zinc transporter, ZIP family
VRVLVLLAAGSATALATGLGAVPVFLLGERVAALRPALWGLASGLMAVASIVGLLLPAADHGSAAEVAGGLAVGALFVGATKLALGGRDLGIAGLRGADVRSSFLVFAVLFVHSLPEGFAVGTAYASREAGLSLFVILAIALQNVPEGTSMAIPMEAAGFGRAQQFWTAVATSAPQPVGALVAYVLVEQISSLLAVSFAFAAGAMLVLVAVELVPKAFTPTTWRLAGSGAIAGAGMMLVLSAALGV